MCIGCCECDCVCASMVGRTRAAECGVGRRAARAMAARAAEGGREGLRWGVACTGGSGARDDGGDDGGAESAAKGSVFMEARGDAVGSARVRRWSCSACNASVSSVSLRRHSRS